MYYNVVVKDSFYGDGEYNQLVFYFGDNKQKALEFATYMAKISEYHIEFLQFEKNEGD